MNYLIIGPGRVGKNMANYLEALGHCVTLVGRAVNGEQKILRKIQIQEADIVALTIPDSELQRWRDEWLGNIASNLVIHFSGSLVIENLFGFHPLYSFPNSILGIAEMKTIAFACPKKGPQFTDVFPGATNKHFTVHDKDRAHYHALAVLCGNFVSYIWNQSAAEYNRYTDNQPSDIMEPYLQSIMTRFLENPENSLTGPLARQDQASIEANLHGLKHNPILLEFYKNFLDAAWPDYPEKKEALKTKEVQ